MAAQAAHNRKLEKTLEDCKKEGLHFVPLAWESTGGAAETVHATIRKWTDLEADRGGYPVEIIRQNLYAQVSCCLQATWRRRCWTACPSALALVLFKGTWGLNVLNVCVSHYVCASVCPCVC